MEIPSYWELFQASCMERSSAIANFERELQGNRHNEDDYANTKWDREAGLHSHNNQDSPHQDKQVDKVAQVKRESESCSNSLQNLMSEGPKIAQTGPSDSTHTPLGFGETIFSQKAVRQAVDDLMTVSNNKFEKVKRETNHGDHMSQKEYVQINRDNLLPDLVSLSQNSAELSLKKSKYPYSGESVIKLHSSSLQDSCVKSAIRKASTDSNDNIDPSNSATYQSSTVLPETSTQSRPKQLATNDGSGSCEVVEFPSNDSLKEKEKDSMYNRNSRDTCCEKHKSCQEASCSSNFPKAPNEADIPADCRLTSIMTKATNMGQDLLSISKRLEHQAVRRLQVDDLREKLELAAQGSWRQFSIARSVFGQQAYSTSLKITPFAHGFEGSRLLSSQLSDY